MFRPQSLRRFWRGSRGRTGLALITALAMFIMYRQASTLHMGTPRLNVEGDSNSQDPADLLYMLMPPQELRELGSEGADKNDDPVASTTRLSPLLPVPTATPRASMSTKNRVLLLGIYKVVKNAFAEKITSRTQNNHQGHATTALEAMLTAAPTAAVKQLQSAVATPSSLLSSEKTNLSSSSAEGQHNAEEQPSSIKSIIGTSHSLQSPHIDLNGAVDSTPSRNMIPRIREEGPLHTSPSPMFGLMPENVELVIAKTMQEDTSWVTSRFRDWYLSIYVADNKNAAMTVPVNKGNEAMVYLTHIINRYDALASVTIFHHAGLVQWHNDVSLVSAENLEQLQISWVRKKGYTSLRCKHDVGCASIARAHNVEHVAWREAFSILNPGEEIPELVGAPCCAQFAVTRELIRKRPRESYERIREWLVQTQLNNAISGRVLEYLWHIMFGTQAVHCPDPDVCYCGLYRRCEALINKYEALKTNGTEIKPNQTEENPMEQLSEEEEEEEEDPMTLVVERGHHRFNPHSYFGKEETLD